MPGSSSIQLHGGQGKLIGPTVYMGGQSRFLTRDHFVRGVWAALSEAGYVAKDYAGHSFRIGAATTAAKHGIQDSLIKTLGRWERGDYKHWTRDPRTRGPGTRGPGTQRSSSVALSFYDRNATCVNVLSSNVRLYRCWSQSPHCYTHC